MVLAVILGTVLSLAVSTGAAAQQHRVRVVDAVTRHPVDRAAVAVLGTDSAEIRLTRSGRDGFADLGRIAPGEYALRVQAEGYHAATVPLTLREGVTTPLPAVLLEPAVLALDSLTARAPDRRPTEARMTPAMHVVAGERLARLESVNATTGAVIRQLSGGLRVREGRNRSICVQATRRLMSFRDQGPCDMVVVVVDGITISDAGRFLGNLHVSTVESMEYVPPMWAGQLYGMHAGAVGALVIWTRGAGPHRSPARDGGVS